MEYNLKLVRGIEIWSSPVQNHHYVTGRSKQYCRTKRKTILQTEPHVLQA